MICPNCENEKLIMTERQGIEIDYCSNCRGIWLDRGELDKLIERSQQQIASSPIREYPSDYERYKEKKYYKKKSFLEEIFD